MQDLISSFLIQTKECHLPGLGSFMVNKIPASLDVADKQIIPSREEIIFTEKLDSSKDSLADYIALKKEISREVASHEIKNWCLQIMEKLQQGKEIHFQSVGVLKMSSSENISFQPETTMQLFEPVAVERIVHKNAEHLVLVGDKETTNRAINDALSTEEKPKRQTWKIAAIILFLVGVSILAFYFYGGAGKQGEFDAASAPATYIAK
ncbi:MAG: hypothetical protein ABIP35_06560 [Ginsengibacter sp.]